MSHIVSFLKSNNGFLNGPENIFISRTIKHSTFFTLIIKHTSARKEVISSYVFGKPLMACLKEIQECLLHIRKKKKKWRPFDNKQCHINKKPELQKLRIFLSTDNVNGINSIINEYSNI